MPISPTDGHEAGYQKGRCPRVRSLLVRPRVAFLLLSLECSVTCVLLTWPRGTTECCHMSPLVVTCGIGPTCPRGPTMFGQASALGCDTCHLRTCPPSTTVEGHASAPVLDAWCLRTCPRATFLFRHVLSSSLSTVGAYQRHQ